MDHRAYLLVSLFITGACGLALELAGVRLISPFYGSSIYSWSAVVTAALAALASGCALGGRLADRSPTLALFERLLTGAGLALAAIPWLRAPVLRASLLLGVKLGALAGAFALIGPGLALLGALVPAAVRLTATNASDAGRRTGDAWALSTAGGVLGAALTGFLLIPRAGLPRVLWGGAAALFALGAVGSWLSTRRLPPLRLAACAACVGLLFVPPRGPRHAVYARESAYGRILVLDAPDTRRLLVNGATESVMLKATGESASDYIRGLEWIRALRPRARRVVTLGLGAGLLAKALERRGLIVDAVELDPDVVDAAKTWFGYEPKGEVIIGDGRASLEGSAKTWDAAVLDAYGGDMPPDHLFTVEFFSLIRRRLEPGGVLAVNLAGAVDGPDGGAWRAVHRTLAAVFPRVRAFAFVADSGLANILFFASDGSLDAPPPAYPADVKGAVTRLLDHELSPSPAERAEAPLLVDDYTPLDILLAHSRARMRAKALSRPEILLD